MKIRTKVGVALVFSIGAAIVGVSVSWFIFEKRQLETSIKNEQISQLNMWAAVCREAKLSRSDLALLSYLRVLKKTEGLSFAYLVNLDGEIVAHTDPRFILRPIKEWLNQNPNNGVLVREQTLGPEGGYARAVVGFSQTYTDQLLLQATRKILRDVVMVGAIILTLGLLIAFLISSYLTRQILPLYRGSEQLGGGNFKTQVPVLSSDELGGLAKRFNQMAKKLGDLNELKDSLIATVSHDLRSPLSGITMYAEYLGSEEKGGLNDKQKRMVDMIKSNASRLGVFINNILAHAKIKDGKMEYAVKPCVLADVVRSACQLSQTTAELRKISLNAVLPGDLPKVQADTERLEQVLNNLVSNALKFTPDGGKITIIAKPVSSSIQVSVIDTGRGIPVKDLGRIFEKFEQVDVADQKSMKISGSGLGLFIAREIIERHGGRIWAESEVGRGTAFHFTVAQET